jgi:hypothetical protein
MHNPIPSVSLSLSLSLSYSWFFLFTGCNNRKKKMLFHQTEEKEDKEKKEKLFFIDYKLTPFECDWFSMVNKVANKDVEERHWNIGSVGHNFCSIEKEHNQTRCHNKVQIHRCVGRK